MLNQVETNKVKNYIAAIAPKFSSHEQLDTFIEMADANVSREYFGSLYFQAYAYFVCHTMEMARRSGDESGMVSSKREGDISVSYQNQGTDNDASMNLTTYGTMFESLKKRCSKGFVMTGCRHVQRFGGHC